MTILSELTPKMALIVLACAMLAGRCLAAERDELGRSEKLRVLVDKVLMRSNNWVMTEDHVRQIAEAGFNVVSPRLGGDDMNEVRKIARLAQKYGIYHMPWMRGTLTAKTGPKLVWSGGTEQDLCSPNSDELWEWMTRQITEYAKISVETSSLMGVFLDYENYAPKKQGNAYALSYDEKIMQAFAQAKGIELPVLKMSDRYPWLKDEGLHDEFTRFQINHWRARCRELRKAVDAINPTFQFCVYPAPGTLFMTEAIWNEWSAEQAPLILADACTYGRPTGMLPHDVALQANRTALDERLEIVQESGISFMYMGGIDPVVRGADPEFSGKNAVMCTDATDGYWIFYEGPTYDKQDHADYWKWFTWANQAIAEGRFEAQYESRETPDEWDVKELERKTDKPQMALYGMKPRMHAMIGEGGKFELHELRGMSYDYLRQLDAVVLQNFNVSLERDNEWVQNLRKYVEDGGGLMLAHDTAWFMASPFPEIAVRDHPTQRVEAVRHVVETDLRIKQTYLGLEGLKPDVEFSTEFRDHMIFKPGPDGTVIIENIFGDPVYVLGSLGKGRVVFTGCYYGYQKQLSGAEREVFFALLDWLAGD